MKLKKLLALVLAGVMTMAILSACGSTDTSTTTETAADETAAVTEESDWDYISDKGTMVIGITLFAPMNYMEDGELVGFETEFATAVCEKLGVTPEFQEIDWGSKEIELNSKNIDCIWNGLTVTEERKENMSITDTYMNNRQVMVATSENAEAYAESVDGASVVAEVDSTGYELISSDEYFANADCIEVDSQAKGLMDVAAGTSDIAMVDYVTSIASIGEGTDYTDLVVVDKEFSGDIYGVAFRKGSDVTEMVNEIIAELKADGTLTEIAEKYGLEDLLILD